MKRTAKKPAGRLRAEAWIDAGIELLINEGIDGIQINRLARHLGVTKGSFYWHFEDQAALFEKIVDRWAVDRVRRQTQLAERAGDDPVARLHRLVAVFLDQRTGRGDRHMRIFARQDSRARSALRAGDLMTFDFLQRAFRDLGFTPREAELRARTLFWVGVGSYATGHPIGRPPRDEPRRVVELLCQGAPRRQRKR